MLTESFSLQPPARYQDNLPSSCSASHGPALHVIPSPCGVGSVPELLPRTPFYLGRPPAPGVSIGVTKNKHKLSPQSRNWVQRTREGSRRSCGPAPQHATQILLYGRGLREQKARRSCLMPKPSYPGGRAISISCQYLKSGALSPSRGSREGSNWGQGRP